MRERLNYISNGGEKPNFDGKITWVKGRVEGDNVYGVQESKEFIKKAGASKHI